MTVATQPRALHAGCGGHRLPSWLSGYDEVGLDINPDLKPDILGSITDIGEVGEFELVYCSHCLEHLHTVDVPKALSEFYRVLSPGGKLVLLVPDLEDVKPTNEVLYTADCGPVTGLDMFYGLGAAVKTNPHMQHHTAFTKQTLTDALLSAGFKTVIVNRVPVHNLMGGGTK